MEIAGQIDAAKDLHDLKTLLREGRMKEFYETANRYMRIKRSNPVVTKVKRSSDNGKVETFEDRIQVEKRHQQLLFGHLKEARAHGT